jgi:hypothetical protein
VVADTHYGARYHCVYFEAPHVIDALVSLDTSDNFYFVVRGEKTFELTSPSQASILPLYPCLHAGYRQVQVGTIHYHNNACLSSLFLPPLD